MSKFNQVSVPDEMDASDYLEMVNKSGFNKGRVSAKHCWINPSQYMRLYSSKDDAIQNEQVAGETLHFASESEAFRYQQLRLEESEGSIVNLEVQPKFNLIMLGDYTLDWKADFQYQLIQGDSAVTIVEDVKGYSEKQGKWIVGNGKTALKMELFEAWRSNFHPTWRFYLVDAHTGQSEYFNEAKFV